MFGEEYMLGVTKQSIDNKGRVKIPIDTKVEATDKLVLINKNVYEYTFLEIWHLNLIKNKIIELERKKSASKSNEEIEYYQNLINYITANTINTLKIDKERRISLGQNYLEKLKESYSKEVVIERMGNYIRIWPEISFKHYKEDTNKKVLKK